MSDRAAQDRAAQLEAIANAQLNDLQMKFNEVIRQQRYISNTTDRCFDLCFKDFSSPYFTPAERTCVINCTKIYPQVVSKLTDTFLEKFSS